VPRVALTLLALRGGDFFSGTRLRFSYATAFMEPDFQETFANLGSGYVPNPGLLPVRTRAFEAGFQQSLLAGRWALNATYFNNLFHDQIEYGTNTVEYMGNPPGTLYQFFNLQQSLAHGAEVQLQGRIWKRLSLNTAYTYTSTQILQAPLCTGELLQSCMTREILCFGAPSIPARRSSAIWERAGARIWEEAS
jgi:outer membrane receptor protein involved in Fe transport